MTLFEIIKIIKDISLLQPNVRTASNGDIFDTLNGNPNVKYGVVHINQTTHNETETTDNYGLNVFYVDRLEVDKNNQLQIQSTGKNIIGNIIHTLCEQFDVDCPNITYTPFTERFKDECAGVYANLTIQIVKDYSCAEQYGEWVKPQITVINNIDATFTENGIYEVPKGYSGFGTVEVAIDYNAIEDKAFQEGYLEGETVGYNDGYVEGIEEQKSLLESIIITENGVYTKEDGYNEITVEVPDLNGSYNEGYNVGYDEGLNDAGEVIAETAQVLNITQNGTYYTKYSDVTPVVDEREITGYYDDGTPFYNYAYVDGGSYDTLIQVSPTTTVELWYKTNEFGSDECVVGSQNMNNTSAIFKFREQYGTIDAEIAGIGITGIEMKTNTWYHLKMSYADGFFVDDVKVGDFSRNVSGICYNLFINSFGSDFGDNGRKNYFGLIKINNQTIIPTEQGFYNITTDTYLVDKDNGTYAYYNPQPPVQPVYEGNLIKTVNVQVDKGIYLPNGVSFQDSTFEEFDFADPKLKYINCYNNFFFSCENLRKIKNFRPTNKCSCGRFFYSSLAIGGDYTIELENCDFSNVVDATEFFDGSPFNRADFDCSNFNFNKLVAVKWMFRNMNNIVTLNLENWDVSNLSLIDGLFEGCQNLEHIYSSSWGEMKVGTTEKMFYNCKKLKEVNMPYLISQYTTGLFQMFTSCEELEYINTSNWDFSNVGDTRFLFNNCRKLNFDFSKFNTKKINNAEYMFSNSGFEKIEMDVDCMENMSKMFENCNSLTEVKFRGNPKRLSNVSNMFYGIKTTGILYYPQEYDYTKIINVLPSTWTAIPY